MPTTLLTAVRFILEIQMPATAFRLLFQYPAFTPYLNDQYFLDIVGRTVRFFTS